MKPKLVSAARLHAAMRALPFSDLATQTGNAPMLILAPHPDDESLGCGGLIAQATQAARQLRVLVLTDGTGSHPNSAAYPAPRLRRIREAETIEAARALGLAAEHVSFLRVQDTRAPKSGAEAERLAAQIAGHAQACGARILFTSWRCDPHSDHLAASLLARKAARLAGASVFEYPVWGWTIPPRRLLPMMPIEGFRLDVTAQLPAKRRAIACHHSQHGRLITDDPAGFTLQPEFLALFTGPAETYLRIDDADA
jgi:LmbE family N-acetylglucosaminyl deacetylase